MLSPVPRSSSAALSSILPSLLRTTFASSTSGDPTTAAKSSMCSFPFPLRMFVNADVTSFLVTTWQNIYSRNSLLSTVSRSEKYRYYKFRYNTVPSHWDPSLCTGDALFCKWWHKYTARIKKWITINNQIFPLHHFKNSIKERLLINLEPSSSLVFVSSASLCSLCNTINAGDSNFFEVPTEQQNMYWYFV